ncbi:OmpA family protein [Anianabacter salinae]|uniref:OmpA family protein n=1 Tax=Anianabacter salinae TaxID=2851023 RepID=UPI00225DE7E6|nr:OmpA family protein [Anianabacter salinae]MBV0913295.1 OmpA family protein [Anianabacter salinae]
MIPAAVIATALILSAAPTLALTLEFPARAVPTADAQSPLGSRPVAVSPYGEDGVQMLDAEGAVAQQAWRIENDGLTTLQILAPLRAQIVAAGFEVLFECETDRCGGFDFRYALDTLPEPEMHVDLGDFRYLAARNTGAGADDYIMLLVSRSANAGFVQMTRIAPDAADLRLIASTKAPPPALASALGLPLIDRLRRNGHATLEDLTFRTGASELERNRYATLEDLARFLKGAPQRRVVLVGHTDATGALDGNIALSRARAQSVVDRLVTDYDVPPEQLSAEGVGFLAPVASNQDPAGRTRNRRVEAILVGE